MFHNFGKTNTMKLYTEEQVKSMLNRAKIFDGDVGENFVYILSESDILSAETPIELPSDEEIDNMDWGSQVNVYHVEGFTAGAKWMKEQILNQDK